MENAIIAVLFLNLETFFEFSYVNFENLVFFMTSMSGMIFFNIISIVSEPRNTVSIDPLASNILFVNTCPRSISFASCISSIAINSTGKSVGIASTVHI